MRFFTTILCLLAFSAAIAEPSKLIDDLRTVLRAERKAAQEKADKTNNYRTMQGDYLLNELPTADAISDEAYPKLLEVITQARRNTLSEKADALCVKLIEELRQKIAQLTEAQRAKSSKLLLTALTKTLSATGAAELDEVIRDLTKMQKALSSQQWLRNQGDSEAPRSINQLAVAVQDAFLAKANPAGAKPSYNPSENLLSIGNSCAGQLTELMPRSEFLEKLQIVLKRISVPQPSQQVARSELDDIFGRHVRKTQAPTLTASEMTQQFEEIIATIKTPGDMAGAIKRMEAFIPQETYSQTTMNAAAMLSQLRYMERIHEDYQIGAGSLSQFVAPFATGSRDTAGLRNVRDMMLRYALPLSLDGPKDMAPKADERIDRYLQRAMAAARAASDWSYMARITDAAGTFNIIAAAGPADCLALRYFISGLNHERAKLYNGAVVAYDAALKTGSALVPAEAIGERLEALKKEHPTEYEIGIKATSAANSSSNTRTYSPRGNINSIIPGVTPRGNAVLPADAKEKSAEEVIKPSDSK